MIREPILLPNDVPFAQAKEMIADPEVDEFGSTEVFVDDLFTTFPALSEDHIKQCAEAIPLAVEIIGHPLTLEELLHRNVLLAMTKAMAEGTPSEILTILGWVINTHCLLILLPKAKAKFWADEIHDIRSKHAAKSSPTSAWNCLWGDSNMLQQSCRREDTSSIVSKQQKTEQRNSMAPTFCMRRTKTSDLWLTFLAKAAHGTDVNLVMSQVPTHIQRTDACECRLGGFS